MRGAVLVVVRRKFNVRRRRQRGSPATRRSSPTLPPRLQSHSTKIRNTIGNFALLPFKELLPLSCLTNLTALNQDKFQLICLLESFKAGPHVMQKCRTCKTQIQYLQHPFRRAVWNKTMDSTQRISINFFQSQPAKKYLYFGNTGFVESAGAGSGIGLVVGSIGFESQRNVGDAGNDDSDSLPAF